MPPSFELKLYQRKCVVEDDGRVLKGAVRSTPTTVRGALLGIGPLWNSVSMQVAKNTLLNKECSNS